MIRQWIKKRLHKRRVERALNQGITGYSVGLIAECTYGVDRAQVYDQLSWDNYVRKIGLAEIIHRDNLGEALRLFFMFPDGTVLLKLLPVGPPYFWYKINISKGYGYA